MQNVDFSPRLRGRRAGGAEPTAQGNAPRTGLSGSWRTALLIVGIAALGAFVGGLTLGLRIGRYGHEEDRIVRNAARSVAASDRARSRIAAESERSSDTTTAESNATERRADESNGGAERREPERGGAREVARDERRPSDQRASDNRLANRSSAEAPSGQGRYVVLLGSYSPEGGRRLVSRLRAMDGIRTRSFQACPAMSEANGSGAFLLTHPHNRTLRRVYVGCFRGLRDANEVLALLKREGLLDSTNAQLIDMQ